MARSRARGPVLWLVRHAQSVWNEVGLVQGQRPAPGLTTAGISQARVLAHALADSGATVVLSSDLRRAVETAKPIANRLGVVTRTDHRLRERNFGSLEGGPSSALVPSVTGYDAGAVVDLEARAPGGESLADVYARVSGWLAEVRATPPAVVFVAVTHGGLLRVARACLAGAALETMRLPPTPNGALWRVELQSGEVHEVSLPTA